MKVYITARLPEEVLAGIAREHSVEAHAEDIPVDRQKLLAGVEGKEGLLCTLTDRIDLEVLERAPDLKIIANNGDGFDKIDIEAATRKGIPVTNTPGVSTDSVADLAFALILATARRLVEGDRMTRGAKLSILGAFSFPRLGRQRQDTGHSGLWKHWKSCCQAGRWIRHEGDLF